ncbi:spore maturation protein CgeB [Lachnospiraceae bacterium]|nr:spore maturation protein CgeB [Lachnospiraceae bacterium]
MKILYMDWKSYCTEDMIPAFEKAGCSVIRVPFTKELGWKSDEYADILRTLVRAEQPDFVYSFNFYPLISSVCEKERCRYVSWVYDSPQVALCHDSAMNTCNMIFLFDEDQKQYFSYKGLKNIYFLPMASNPDRIRQMILTDKLRQEYTAQISFVGSLYSEKKHRFYERFDGINDYTRGYLDALTEAQMRVYGANFIEDSLRPDVISEMMRVFPMMPHEDGSDTVEWLYSEYILNRHVTAQERSEILTVLSEQYDVKLYTNDTSWTSGKIKNCGPVDYYDTAPFVFKSSSINLNITLRSIKSGIPLRAFDIMASEGFLMTSFTADFLKFFIPNEDFVFYESTQNLLDTADYYLVHEDERKRIAENGYKKICRDHTFDIRVSEIFDKINRS